MSFIFRSFASGSSGNSYLVATEETALLIDTGIAGKRIKAGLADSGFSAQDLSGILITHEHIDHVRSIRMIAGEAAQARVYASPGTLDKLADRVRTEQMMPVVAEDGALVIGDITVTPFRLSHDAAEPLGYCFSAQERKIAVMTDTGIVTDRQLAEIIDADMLVMEANHEKNVLLMCDYPYELKQRILGDHGHISNDDAADNLIRIMAKRNNPRTPVIALAHLSHENNSPRMAAVSVSNRLAQAHFLENRDYYLTVLLRDEMSDIFDVGAL